MRSLAKQLVFTAVLIMGGSVSLYSQNDQFLDGFSSGNFWGEQVVTFRMMDEMTIHINAAALDSIDPELPVGLALYALPNGNSIEHTVGKVLNTGDDWHFDIQHIGAQTRFLRDQAPGYNLITVYLEADQLSWPAWKASYPNYDDIIQNTVDYLLACFQNYEPFIILTGHSGGGRFIFSFLDGVTSIPDHVKRICFLDSNYGYEHSYGDQFISWLDGAPDRYLSVLAYNDSVALYNGEPIVSPTGGTWYRSRIMQQYLAQHYEFTTLEDSEFIRHTALDGRIKILLKKNPTQAILHTVQVERNGFIHSMLTGTTLEEIDYTYYGERAYANMIQAEALTRPRIQFPLRRLDAPTGSHFMNAVINMSFNDREAAMLEQLVTGNFPYFMRDLHSLSTSTQDHAGVTHEISYDIMPDYLAIGSDTDYCRVPMGPITAQKIANFFRMSMPTRKLVVHIYTQANIHLAPVTYAPVGNLNEGVPKFIEHNAAIQAQLSTLGATPGQIVGGTKKDVVLSNLIADPTRPGHVCIYGWHQLNGQPIQPLTNIHTNTYVDYSHGIRLIGDRIRVDGVDQALGSILQDANLFELVSDESTPMYQPTYIPDGSLPTRPGSFGAFPVDSAAIQIVVANDPNVLSYTLELSANGTSFGTPIAMTEVPWVVNTIPTNGLIFFRLSAQNLAGTSAPSEVLAARTSSAGLPPALIVNGFDRSSAGNTYDFSRQHAQALTATGYNIASATNDAILDGLLDLSDYWMVDYILGEESTADETFSTAEQTLVASYLRQGGRLFVSGAEIAWDLDYRGSTADKQFIHNFLKASYSADAPGGVSGVHYGAEGISGSVFDQLGSFNYDNGTHGTFNVRYPDALVPLGSHEIVRYLNVSTHSIGGISYEGMFPGGSEPGKLIYLGFPFETVYPEEIRISMMESITDYLAITPSSVESASNLPDQIALHQNYPNPFNAYTHLRIGVPASEDISLYVYDMQGRLIRTLYQGPLPSGWYEFSWDGSDQQGRLVSSGAYLAQVRDPSSTRSIKMLLLK